MSKPHSKILHGLLLATTGLVASTVIASTAAAHGGGGAPTGGGPTGPTVVVGSATITNNSNSKTTVNQTSNKALINWDSFSIPTGSTVQFVQPNSNAIAVNRVTGNNASTIDGALLANGNVWLINANGILFGSHSQINVGALIATTSDINNDDFKNGKYTFQPASNANASVDNKGTITVNQGGSVVLSAPQVSNEGLIQANLGTVVLGGAKAFTVDLNGDNLLTYEITAPVTSAPKTGDHGSVAAALVSNSGQIEAAGGRVILTTRAAQNVQDNVINNTGMVEATTVSSHNGEIDLDAGANGTVNDSGTLDASGSDHGETGGAVNVTGNTINIADHATINASGDAGGGTIQIGGGLHGQGSLAHAQNTNVGNATIRADATGTGNGGTVVLWSDGNTSVSGTITSKGGAHGGNGGEIETSGQNFVVGNTTDVETSAPLGLTGEWLIDPKEIDVGLVEAFVIDLALRSTNITLQATGNRGSGEINVVAPLSYSSSNSLNLLSNGDISVNATIQNYGSGDINLIAGWDGHTTNSGSFGNSGVYGNNGGSVYLGGHLGPVSVGSDGGLVRVEGYDITLSNPHLGPFQTGYAQIGFHGDGGGDIEVLAVDRLTLGAGEGGSLWQLGSQIGNGSDFDAAGSDGNITIKAANITTSSTGYIAGHSADITVTGGDIGSSNTPLLVALDQLAIADTAGNAYILSAKSISLGVGADGVNLGTHNLTLNANGSIGQTDAVVAGVLTANGTSVTLTNAGNRIGTAYLTASSDASLTDSVALTIGGANVSGNLTLIDTGAIGQNGTIVASTLSVNGTNITLTKSGNRIGVAYLNASANASFTDGIALTVGGANVTGNLTLSANGSIGQSGAIVASSFTANGTTLTFTNAANRIGTVYLTATGDASLTDSIDLTVGSASIGGNLTLADGGAIGQTGAIATSVLTANGTNITLANGSNAIGTAYLTASGDASLADSRDLTVGSANVIGSLVLTDAGNITQNGSIAASTLNASGANITLTNGGNRIETAFITASGDASLIDGIDLAVGGANVTGTLTLTDSGNITQSGSIAATVLIANGSNIALTDADNQVGTAYLSATGDAALADNIDLIVGGANVTGNLTLTDAGNITQSGAILASALIADGADITLTDADNQVGTADLTATGDASLTDGIDLIVGGANVTGNLTLTGNGTIGQTGAVAAANLTVSGTNITLANSNNTINTAYLTASGDALLADGSDLTVGNANVTGTFTLTGAGAIGQSGAILASFLVASGTNITLTNSGNAFGTASITASGDASLYDGSALILAGAHVTGNLALTDASTIGQSGAISAASLTANGTTLTFTDGGNQIGTAYLTATGDAALNDSVALTVGGANVTGNLTLTSAGDIGQSGAIMATILTASGSNLTLANAGNQIGTAYLAATGSASLFDSLGLTIGGANVTGNLTLTGNGSINQSGAIIASSLTAGGTSLTFTNSGNKIGTAYLTASGNASLYDGVALTVGGANVTGNLTLTDASTIGQTGAIVAGTLSANGTNITLTNSGNKIGTAYLTASGNAALTDSLALMVGGANITGNLTLTDTGAISQNGSIVASSLMANGTNITLTNGGNRIGKATLTASGDATLTDSVALTVGGANVTGNLTLTDTGSISQTGAIAASVLTANGTSLAFTDAGNKIGAADLTASGNAALYDATSLTLDGAGIGGNLTLLSKGDLDFISSVQLTNGSILAVAGWDGTTATPSANGTYGNHGGSIVIGGSNAAGNVAVGSKNGTTSLLADDIALSAVRGYAQVGYHGGGNGAIVVTAAGDVSLTGGSSTARYAQIGDGGYKVAGSNNAAITVDAAGNVTLSAGSGQEAYAQIGNGGAESNSNSSGYVNTGDITIGGEQVVLDAGSGSGSYAQIGNGGFKSGRSLSGNATIGGDIVVNAVNAVTLTGGGTDAYAQIGNAGDYTNSNAADGSGGTTSGEITVSVSSPIDGVDPIILTAGSGAQSYVQIGNGGDFENDPAPGANVSFTVSGNVTINDITIIGSNTGANAYGQIGNGDAAGTGTGDISGDIAVTAGTSFTIVNGMAPGTSAIIANDTGNGTSTGAISGYKSPSSIASDPGTIGTVENTVQNPTTPTDENATIFEPSPNMYYTQTQHIDVETTAELPYPLNELAGGDSENFTPSDDATQRLADSLEHPKIASVQVIVPGLLKQVNDLSAQAIAGVPPADEEYSSWGNQALWTW